MINPTDLTYFVEVARQQHMSRAAERLGVTQPALSRCLQRLENQLGTALFLRSKKGLILTAAGVRLKSEAQGLLQQWSDVLRSVHDETHEVRGSLRLGCHTAVAQYTLPSILPGLLKANPKLNVQLVHGLSRHMTEDVISGRIDAALVVNPVAHPDLVIREIGRDVVGLYRKKDCINSDVLMIDPHLLQTQDILRQLQRRGLRFERLVESSSLEVLKQLLFAGAGCAILPGRVVGQNASVELLPDSPTYSDRICLIYKPEFKKTPKGKALWTFAKNEC